MRVSERVRVGFGRVRSRVRNRLKKLAISTMNLEIHTL
jgi:hypothetical protein